MDRVLALHVGSLGFDSHRGHMSERFFRSNRPGYPHPVNSELENSGISYQTGKTVHVHAKHYKLNEDGRTVPGVWDNGSVPLRHSGNVVKRIGIYKHMKFCYSTQVLPLLNNPKDLDPSYKMDLDIWHCLRRI